MQLLNLLRAYATAAVWFSYNVISLPALLFLLVMYVFTGARVRVCVRVSAYIFLCFWCLCLRLRLPMRSYYLNIVVPLRGEAIKCYRLKKPS